MFGIEQIGLGAPNFGSVPDILDPFVFVPKADTLQRHAQLGLGLGQDIFLLFIGNADEDLPLVYPIAEIGIDIPLPCLRFQR